MEEKLKLLRSSHSVGESNYHLQFTPKYRKKVFANPIVRIECERILTGIANQLGIIMSGIGFGQDHVHLFVSNCKNFSPVELARRLKGASSRMLRANLCKELRPFYWGDSFWSDGFFYRSVGAVTAEVMQNYVSVSQQKHWQTQDLEDYKKDQQKTLAFQHRLQAAKRIRARGFKEHSSLTHCLKQGFTPLCISWLATYEMMRLSSDEPIQQG